MHLLNQRLLICLVQCSVIYASETTGSLRIPFSFPGRASTGPGLVTAVPPEPVARSDGDRGQSSAAQVVTPMTLLVTW